MADTPVVEQLTLDQELENLQKSLTPDAPKVETPEKEITPIPATPQSETPVAIPQEPTLEDKLKEIEEPKIEEAAKPALTPEQQQVLAIVPNAQVAQQVTQLAEGYKNFTSAFENRNFDEVESMLQSWRPDLYEAFQNHFYQKYVKGGDMVDRWIRHQENPLAPEIDGLQKKIDRLESLLQGRSTEEQTRNQQIQQQQRVQAYQGHLNSLFEKIQFSPNDRRWVIADINAAVSARPDVQQAILAGDISAVNGIFKKAVQEYVRRDQIANDKATADLKAQEAKKPPIAASPAQETSLPDDIRDVPKGKEDDWMDAQFAKLARIAKRG